MLFLCLALCSAAYNQAFRNFMHKIEIDMRVSNFKIIILLMNFKKNQIEPSLFAQQSALKHPILSSYIPIN
jgi:hypothetical protein